MFGDRWFALDLPRHLVHVPAPALLARLRVARPAAVQRVSYLRGGQVVFGWLHGLVGALPCHPDLYDAIRRPEARARADVARGGGCRRSPRRRWRSRSPRSAPGWRPLLRRGGTVYVEARHG